MKQGKYNPSYKHGLSHHPLYKVFAAAKYRCINTNNRAYKTYKGRWGKNTIAELTKYYLKEYEKFVRKYPHLIPSIDRINEDGKYEIGNMQIIDLEENKKKYWNIKGHPKPALGKFGKDHNSSKAVEGLIDGRWRKFGSMQEAERETGVQRSNIGSVCNGCRYKSGKLKETAGKDKQGNRIKWRYAIM